MFFYYFFNEIYSIKVDYNVYNRYTSKDYKSNKCYNNDLSVCISTENELWGGNAEWIQYLMTRACFIYIVGPFLTNKIVYYDVGYYKIDFIWVIIMPTNYCWPVDVDYRIGIVEEGNNK